MNPRDATGYDLKTGTYDPGKLAGLISRQPVGGLRDKRDPTGRTVRHTQARIEPGPVKPPPDPENRELLAAAAERKAYFDYLQGKGPRPPAPKYPQYWPERKPAA